MYKLEVSFKELPNLFYTVCTIYEFELMLTIVVYLCRTHKYRTVKVTDTDKDC